METIAGKAYGAVTLDIDDRQFLDCVFDKTTLRYSGGPTRLDGCDFLAVRWHFAGAAGQTAALVRALSTTAIGAPLLHDMFPEFFASHG